MTIGPQTHFFALGPWWGICTELINVLAANPRAPAALLTAPMRGPTLLIRAAADTGDVGIVATIAAEARAAMDKSLSIGISVGLREVAWLRAKFRPETGFHGFVAGHTPEVQSGSQPDGE